MIGGKKKHLGFAACSALVLVLVVAVGLSSRLRTNLSGVSRMQVEVDVYSGRPNPRWDLSSPQAEEFLKMVRYLPKRERDSALDQGLGYRGIIITGAELNREGYNQIVISNSIVAAHEGSRSQQFTDQDRALERWLLQTGKGQLEDDLYEYLSEETLK